MLATVCILTIDPVAGYVEQANAGHWPTLIRHQNDWLFWEATCPPIGVLPDLLPDKQEIVLKKGDLIVVYSDGFSEIELEANHFWAQEGILNAIPNTSHDAKRVVEAVVEAAKQVRGLREVHDDQTLVVAHFGQ